MMRLTEAAHALNTTIGAVTHGTDVTFTSVGSDTRTLQSGDRIDVVAPITGG